MYGLEVVARGSKSIIAKNSDAAFIYFSGVYNCDDDERNWSFSYLRKQLLQKDCQELFRKYQVRVQHALFVELLAFNVVYNALMICAYVFFPDQEALSDLQLGVVKTGKWSRSFSFVVQFLIFIAAYKEDIFKTPCAKILSACLILFCMCLGEMATSFYRIVYDAQQSMMRHMYYIIITTTVLLPFPRKLYSGISGAAVIMVDLLLSSLSNLKTFKTKTMTIVMLADLTFHVTLLVVGLGIRYLIEVMSRRAFLDRRECIESKIKYEMEKHQEDKFLKTILPSHIAKEVREDIRHVIKNIDNITYKPFNKLYVEKYEGVSILYADIVNSMLLATSLNACDLVATLNDLFKRFDDSLEKNGCMRIKLLGDCYYCVSGIPDKSPRHADNCVRTALDMIDVIRNVREERSVNVDMRIGIHSGNILGGLLGLRKWQFDIWSRDVTIASHMEQGGVPGNVREERSVNVDMRIGIHSGNILGGLLGLRKWQFDIWSRDVTIASHMEQGGVPGHVHITRATKNNLKDDYNDIYPGNGHQRDVYLQSEEIETFLIKPRATPSCIGNAMDGLNSEQDFDGISCQRQVSTTSLSKFPKKPSSTDSFLPTERRGALEAESTLTQFSKMVRRVNKIMEKTIDKMALSKTDQWFSKVGIQPLFLTFRESGHERPFLEQPDPLFKYYLLCMLLIFCGMTIIHLLITSRTLEFWISYGVLLLLILAACIPSWAGYIWLSLKKDDSDKLLDASVLKISRTVWKTPALRVAIWLIISVMILFCSVAGLNECFKQSFFRRSDPTNTSFTARNESVLIEDAKDISCRHPWFYTLCAALAMTTTSVFLRIHFLVKLAVNVGALAVFWYIMDFQGEELFAKTMATLVDWNEFNLPFDHSHCYYLTLVVLILHILDRQVEYICRLDYLMKVKLKAEQEEAHSMELVNRLLLFNILPPHVSRYYLSRQLEDQSERIEIAYHQERSAVAVLFASIPNFAHFYYEDGGNEEGLRCIQLLNEIICGFDLLLNEREFGSVEKIKTIGSTYMAACDLLSQENDSTANDDDPTNNVVTLVKFSVAMMSSLHQLNKDAMQDFQLRIGISVGPVMEGVIGTVTPQYDIWGDTVNIASRMDSTGILGRIQVTKEVADCLTDSGCPYECECRGEIFVKGKGMMTTYLIKTLYDEPQIQTTSF